MVAFPKIPNFNFNGSNPLIDETENVRGQLAASGYLDMTVQDLVGRAGAAIGIDLNNVDLRYVYI